MEFTTGFTGLTGFEAQGLNRLYVFDTGKTSLKPPCPVLTVSPCVLLFDTRRLGLLHYFQMVNEP